MYSSIIIGAGFSGICLAIKLKNQGIQDFIILEKAAALGGTWRDNTYPGAECDIPSALYSYSFEPYPYWEHKWSHQDQILEYLKFCADKYDVLKHIRFKKELESASWEEEERSWKITTKDKEVFSSKTFVTAIGQLHHPSVPVIKGQDKFIETAFHSARWNHNTSLAGKKIGVIGNAASAVQFIPQIAKEAGQVHVFQRSANWMLPKLDRMYRDWEKRLVRWFPFLLKIYRFRLWLLGGGVFFLMNSGNNWFRKYQEAKAIKYIKKHIKDPKMVEALTPKYPMGAKRILISDDYYKALALPNISLVTEPISHFDEHAVHTKNGENYPIDVLIYATGFKANPFLSGLQITGRDGIGIDKVWSKGPINYLGMMVSGFPNMFMMYGPNTNLGHNSIIIMSEAQSKYISTCIHRIQKKKWKSIDVKRDILEKYHTEIQSRLKDMIWNSIDKSWYKSDSGNIPNNWPGRTMEYVRRTASFNKADYHIDG